MKLILYDINYIKFVSGIFVSCENLKTFLGDRSEKIFPLHINFCGFAFFSIIILWLTLYKSIINKVEASMPSKLNSGKMYRILYSFSWGKLSTYPLILIILWKILVITELLAWHLCCHSPWWMYVNQVVNFKIYKECFNMYLF